MHSAGMGVGDTPSSNKTLHSGRPEPSPYEFLPVSRLEQVAAVCYRLREGGIEFLLVRTRRGRWTFPKGGPELGLTGPQTAAVEALEEAGAQGRIEEVCFIRYRRGKRAAGKESAAAQTVVNAYLLEVEHLGTPQELNRQPTWFSPNHAKLQLREDRLPENAAELAGVIDSAVRRIRRAHNSARRRPGPLPKVTFETDQEELL